MSKDYARSLDKIHHKIRAHLLSLLRRSSLSAEPDSAAVLVLLRSGGAAHEAGQQGLRRLRDARPDVGERQPRRVPLPRLLGRAPESWRAHHAGALDHDGRLVPRPDQDDADRRQRQGAGVLGGERPRRALDPQRGLVARGDGGLDQGQVPEQKVRGAAADVGADPEPRAAAVRPRTRARCPAAPPHSEPRCVVLRKSGGGGGGGAARASAGPAIIKKSGESAAAKRAAAKAQLAKRRAAKAAEKQGGAADSGDLFGLADAGGSLGMAAPPAAAPAPVDEGLGPDFAGMQMMDQAPPAAAAAPDPAGFSFVTGGDAPAQPAAPSPPAEPELRVDPEVRKFVQLENAVLLAL